jgi:invasion protein IalB
MPFTYRLAGSMAALVLALSSSPGLSQGTGQGSKPKQPAPQGQQAQSPNGGPVIVQLKPEPVQPDWTKVCEKNEGTKTGICYTTRDFVTDKGQRILAVDVYDAKGKKAQKTVRLLTPLGLLVPPGVRITVGKGRPVGGRYTSCLPHGCFAEASVKESFVATLKKGTTLNVSARNQAGTVVTFALPTDGFGKAFDGPPVDPKVMVEQQKKMQEELQKRAEELRGRLMSDARDGTQSSAASHAQTQTNN